MARPFVEFFAFRPSAAHYKMARGERAEHNSGVEGVGRRFRRGGTSVERNFSLGQESVLVRRKIQGNATSKLGKRAEPAKTRLDGRLFFSSI